MTRRDGMFQVRALAVVDDVAATRTERATASLYSETMIFHDGQCTFDPMLPAEYDPL
jgi:hypothetical protein